LVCIFVSWLACKPIVLGRVKVVKVLDIATCDAWNVGRSNFRRHRPMLGNRRVLPVPLWVLLKHQGDVLCEFQSFLKQRKRKQRWTHNSMACVRLGR
jgi:hypothetical protein